MYAPPYIRRAQPADAAACVPLIIDAIGDIAHTLSGSTNAAETLCVLTHFFAQRHNRISYQHTWVALHPANTSTIVGVMVAYHGSEAALLDQPYIQRIQQQTRQAYAIVTEAQANEYYIDTLSIAPAYRGYGYGTALIRTAEQYATQQQHAAIALLVDTDNHRAYQLYHRLGYRSDSQLHIAQHCYWHLTKPLTTHG